MELLYTIIIICIILIEYVKSKSLNIALISIIIITTFLPSHLFILGGKSPSNVCIYTLICIFTYLTIKHKIIRDKIYRSTWKLFTRLTIILIVLALLSYKVALHTEITYIKYQVLSFIAPLFITATLKNEQDFKILEITFWTMLIVSGIYSIYCYIVGSNPFGSFMQAYTTINDRGISEGFIEEIRGALKGRVQGFTDHPLSYAGVLISTFYVIFQSFLLKENKIIKSDFIYIVIIFFTLACIFMTGSRAGVISILIGIIYFYFNTKRKSFLFYTMIAILFVYAGGALFIQDDYIRSIIFFWENNQNISGSSKDLRIDQLNAVFKLIDDNLQASLFGLGNNWCQEYANKNGIHPELYGFESILFSGIINYGLIGFLLYYGGIFFAFYRMNKRYAPNKKIRFHLNSFLITAFCFFLFTGTYGFNLFITSYFIMLRRQSLKSIFNNFHIHRIK